MTVEVKFTNVRLSTLLLKLRGRGWPAAGGGVAHVGVEVWWITVVETHTLCLYIHTRSLPSWLKNTVVLSKIQDIHVWCVGSTTVSGEMSMWQLSPGSSCRVCLSSSSYSNFMKATCPCWSLKQIQFHPYICMKLQCSSDQNRPGWQTEETNKQTNKHKSRLKTSKQVYSLWYSPVHYISTWRSCNCMSIAFSRLFLLSRLMVTWLPWTSRRFCLSTSSSLLREMGLVVAGSAHIWWELTWSCLFSPRRALFGKQDLSKTGWRCNKGESCCCDMLRYVIIIKHEICRIFYYSGFSHLELVEFSSALVCLITDLPTVSSRGSRIWEASRGWKIFMVFTFSRWSRPNPRSLGWRYSRMIKAGSPMAGPDDPRLRSSSVMLSKSEDFHIIWLSKTQEYICNAPHGGLIWFGS